MAARTRRRAVRSFRAAGKEKARPSERGKQWGAASAVLTQAAHSITSPLSVKFFPEATTFHPDHPAGLANMLTHIISIDSDLVGGDPNDLSKPLTKENIAELEALMGVLFHEAGHIAHTYEIVRKGYRNPDSPADELAEAPDAQILGAIATILEEPRMEARTAEANPRTKHYLRACARHLILPNMPPQFNGASAAITALTLIYGRAMGGTLLMRDAQAVIAATEEVMGTKDGAEAMKLVAEAVRVSDLDAPHELPRIARELYKLVPQSEKDQQQEGAGVQVIIRISDRMDPAADEIPPPPQGGGGSGAGDGEGSGGEGSGAGDDTESADGTGSGDGVSDERAKELAEEIADAIDEAVQDEIDAAAEGGDSEAAKVAEELGQIAEDIRKGGPSGTMNKGGKGGSFPGRASGQIPAHGDRPPVALEITVAGKLCERLRRARGKKVMAENRIVPPGRFRSQGAVSQAADRSRGAIVTGKAFRDKRTVKAELWNPECGLVVDTSGSMGIAEGQLGSVVWVCQEAIFRMGGSFAAALFGNGTQPLVGRGKRLIKVPEIQTAGGTDFLPEALDHLEDNLHLHDQRKPRIVVMVTDGQIMGSAQATERITALRDRNVAVVQVNLRGPGTPLGVKDVKVIQSTLEIADVIGNACVKELERRR